MKAEITSLAEGRNRIDGLNLLIQATVEEMRECEGDNGAWQGLANYKYDLITERRQIQGQMNRLIRERSAQERARRFRGVSA